MTRTPAVMEIEPCPFCRAHASVFQDDGDYYVSCTECWSQSPLKEEKTEAIAAWNRRTPAEPLADGEMIEKRAHEIALASLYWNANPVLVRAAEELRVDRYNNRKGHLSSYMAGRFLDAFMAAREALSAYNPNDRLREALEALVNKLDECEAPLRNIMSVYYAHGHVYNGPSYFNELEQARAALSHKD